MSDELVKRLRGWPISTAANVMRDAADRIEELEAELKGQAMQYLSDTGQMGERIGELTEVLEVKK